MPTFLASCLASCVIAFSTYSRLPMPQVDWNEKNMRYTLAFFPLVGMAVGGIFYAVGWFSKWLGFGGILQAALLTAIPAIITGGIHLDGFCDTVDALASHASRERKLEIMKDSGAGAFAVIWCCVWFLAYFALLTEVESLPTIAAGFVLSRALSARAVETLPSARAGMGAVLKSGSCFPGWVLAWYLAIYVGSVLLWGEWLPGAAALLAAAAFYFYYKSMATRQFGGFTGDLAGWFLQICELVILAAVVLTEQII